jgi:hypothetical protein
MTNAVRESPCQSPCASALLFCRSRGHETLIMRSRLSSVPSAKSAVQLFPSRCYSRELRIPGRIFRTVFPNDKREILNDKFSIQTQRFGCGLPHCALAPLRCCLGTGQTAPPTRVRHNRTQSHSVAPSRSDFFRPTGATFNFPNLEEISQPPARPAQRSTQPLSPPHRRPYPRPAQAISLSSTHLWRRGQGRGGPFSIPFSLSFSSVRGGRERKSRFVTVLSRISDAPRPALRIFWRKPAELVSSMRSVDKRSLATQHATHPFSCKRKRTSV